MHSQDLPLFDKGVLDLSHVLTLRAGELAFDQPQGRLLPLRAEMLKLRGEGGRWTCLFFDAASKGCGLYANRPAECRALNCRDTSELAAMYDQQRLTRADLLPPEHPMLQAMAEHEEMVPAAQLPALAAALLAGGDAGHEASARLVHMALADDAFRRALRERLNIGPEFHEFFLGREAGALFAAAGLTLRPDARHGYSVQPDPLTPTPNA